MQPVESHIYALFETLKAAVVKKLDVLRGKRVVREYRHGCKIDRSGVSIAPIPVATGWEVDGVYAAGCQLFPKRRSLVSLTLSHIAKGSRA